MNSYDFLKYLTVNINAKNISEDKPHICSATGFYAIINNTPVIVTARHFVIPTESAITVSVHYKENDTIITIPITANVRWYCSDEYDIAYCKVKPIAEKFKEITGKDMFYTAISEKDIMTKEEFNKINILSEVLTIGYPKGISSTHHKFPLFKKGYISSLPSDFAEDREGYLDLCAEEGYSGSPIFLNNSQIKLVGVLVQCIGNSKKPQSTTIYVSADKILEIKDYDD